MEYLTVNSKLRVSIRGFTKKADADGATFSLLRSDNQKKVLDQTATQVKKTAQLNPVTWEITIDEAIIKAAITDDEMQCGVSVSVTAAGKTWSPPGEKYVIYRNRITLAAKDKDGANLAGARCTCTIRKPPDYHPKSTAAGEGEWEGVPNTVTTKDDGTAEMALAAPGELNLEWAYPYYPEDNAAWTALTGMKRETVLLERERKAHFIWPEVAKGEEQKHFVNLRSRPSSNTGRKLRIEVGSRGGLAGDKIYLTAELTSDDTADVDGEPLKCKLEGEELEVGKPKKTLTLTLDADGGSREAELDLKGYGGITAKLAVSTVEGSTDETVDVTSWRKLDVQPYHPASGFFPGNTVPEALAGKVKECFEEVFIEVEFLKSRDLASAFPGIEQAGKFDVVKISGAHAKATGLDPGPRSGDAALVYFKMDRFAGSTPADWIRQNSATEAPAQTALHAVFAHSCYEARKVSASLILSGDQLVSEPQTAAIALAPRNIDVKENRGEAVLPWSSSEPSYWQVVGEDTRGTVTMDFIEVDTEKAKGGEYEYRIQLPDHAPGDPRKLAKSGKKIKVNVTLRAYEFTDAGENLAPVLYIALNPDYASAGAAYSLIHELAHGLGFAPAAGEFFYNVSGRHCAAGIKSDAEAYVTENQGTTGATVGETLSKGVPGRNVPIELAGAGKFGTCVMWGHAHRQKTTEDMFGAALKFCSSCAPLIRVTSINSIIGREP